MRPMLLLPLVLLAVACGDGHDHDGHAHDDHADEHVHVAPRGGALVVLAEETAHVEVLLDPGSGHLALFVLGPHAETPVRIAQEAVELTLTVDGTETTVTLPAIASELTGETVGDTSEFAADVDALKGVSAFRGRITTLSARGSTYEGVTFTYP